MEQESARVDEMLAHLRSPLPLDELGDKTSAMSQFYAGRSVFITGATGFIGKTLVEKLLYSCPEIKKIYLLIRDKKGKSVDERISDLISLQFFDRVRARSNGRNDVLKEKLYAVKGDITLPLFGISPSDLELLANECSVVFNSAATVRFTEPIEVAARENIYSVSQLMELCDRLNKLEALVHLSTAYSNCHKRDTIHEKYYEPPMSGDHVLKLVDELRSLQQNLRVEPEVGSSWRTRDAGTLQVFRYDDDKNWPWPSKPEYRDGMPNLLEAFTDNALRNSHRPNTYTFTKAVSESLLVARANARPERYLNDKIQVAIVRPSIVGCSWREPLAGQVDNFNGPTWLVTNLYTGAVQVIPGNGQIVVDFIPVDMVVNTVISAAYFLAGAKGQDNASGQTIKPDRGVYFFNCVSRAQNPLRYCQLADNSIEMAYKYPSKHLARLPSARFIRSGRMYDLLDFYYHVLPAKALDFVRRRVLLEHVDDRASAERKVARLRNTMNILEPFISNSWLFDNSNTRNLFQSLSSTDRNIFHFDVKSIDWDQYFRTYIIGARTYLMKETPTTVHSAARSLNRRQILNSCGESLVMLVISILILYCVLNFFNN